MVRTSRKRVDKSRKIGDIGKFLGSLRGVKSDGYRLPTSMTVEKALIEGPLPERSDLEVSDLGGITFLRVIGEQLGIPEYVREAEIWLENLISKHRLGRTELVATIKAKIERELELAKIESKQAETQAGRERRV